jgi:hypothetical protein
MADSIRNRAPPGRCAKYHSPERADEVMWTRQTSATSRSSARCSATGGARPPFFAVTGYGGTIFLFRQLVREHREHLADVRAAKTEFRETNPVLRELGNALGAVRDSAKPPDESPLLRRMEVLLEAVEADRRSRKP